MGHRYQCEASTDCVYLRICNYAASVEARETETTRDMAWHASAFIPLLDDAISRWTVLPTRTLKEGRPDRDEH